MYYRHQGYRGGNMSLPPNYGGNTFAEKEEQTEDSQSKSDDSASEEARDPIEPTIQDPPAQFASEPAEEAGLFKKNSFLGGKIGSEELLLLAVIFLISDSEGSDDILWLLILLLFIK